MPPRKLTPAEIANLLGRVIDSQSQFYVGQSSGGQPGQFLQVNGIQARCMEQIPPGQVILVRYGDEWRAYAPRNPAPVVRVVQNTRRRPRTTTRITYQLAILYEVLNGTDSEIWLQDNGGEPVLITTIPTRIELGWSVYTPSTAEQPDGALRNIFIGHVQRRLPTFRVPLDPKPTWNPPEIATRNMSITLSNFPNGINLGYGLPPYAEVRDRFIDFFGEDELDSSTFFSDYSVGNINAELFTQLTTYGVFSNGETVTINSIANFCDAHVQRRKGSTWVYLRHGLYASQTEPYDTDMSTNAWVNIVYWGNGALLDPEEPDSADITSSVLETPRGNDLIVVDPDSPWGEDTALRQEINLFDNATAYLTSEDLSSFLPDEETVKTVNNVPIIVRKPNGSQSVVGRQSFKGAPVNAKQVLSVAIYPKDS